jgi:hypothetical protein
LCERDTAKKRDEKDCKQVFGGLSGHSFLLKKEIVADDYFGCPTTRDHRFVTACLSGR